MRERLKNVPEVIRQVFENGGDYYKALAAHILQKPVAEVTKEERFRVKETAWWWFTMRGPAVLTDLIQGEEDE